MPSPQAEILLRKEAVAQRQLDAAIRMLLAGEDQLAVHTVAAAAYGILRGLKEAKHGRKELNDRLGVGIFAVASDLASGKISDIPPIFAQSQSLSNIITDITNEIKAGRVKSEKDVSPRLAVMGERVHWAKFNKPANFLKHADSDPDDVLATDALNTDAILVSAISAYVEIMGSPTWEMIVYAVYCGLDIENFPTKLRTIAARPRTKRRRACVSLLHDLKTRGQVALT